MKTANLLLIALALFAPAGCLEGQTCVYNFSEYNNLYPSSDGSTIYTSVSVVDDSGCNHSDYNTTASITSPSGRTAYATTPGLFSESSLAFDNESGSWSTQTSGTFWCPVFQGYAGFGNGWLPTIAITVTYYQNPIPTQNGCMYTATACLGASQPSCTGGGSPTFPQPCSRFLQVYYLKVVELGVRQCFVVPPPRSWPGPGTCN